MEMKQSLLPASDDSGVTPLKRKVERPSGAEGGCECEGEQGGENVRVSGRGVYIMGGE